MYIMKDAEENADIALKKIISLMAEGRTFYTACNMLNLSEGERLWMKEELNRLDREDEDDERRNS